MSANIFWLLYYLEIISKTKSARYENQNLVSVFPMLLVWEVSHATVLCSESEIRGQVGHLEMHVGVDVVKTS